MATCWNRIQQSGNFSYIVFSRLKNWELWHKKITSFFKFSNFILPEFRRKLTGRKKTEKKLDRTHTGQISSTFPNNRAPGRYSTYLWQKMAENGIKFIHPFYYLLPGKLLVAGNAHLKTKRKPTEPKTWTTFFLSFF